MTGTVGVSDASALKRWNISLLYPELIPSTCLSQALEILSRPSQSFEIPKGLILSPEEWAAKAYQMQREGVSIVDIANSLRAFEESGGRKINAVSLFGKECGWSVKQKLELLSWTEGGVTDEELIALLPWP